MAQIRSAARGGWLLGVLLAGCAGPGAPTLSTESPRYRCENGIELSVRFVDDTAVLDGPGGRNVLYRDAGGVGPQQTVYSNRRMRAEFGLGTTGREAILCYLLQPLVLRCVRSA